MYLNLIIKNIVTLRLNGCRIRINFRKGLKKYSYTIEKLLHNLRADFRKPVKIYRIVKIPKEISFNNYIKKNRIWKLIWKKYNLWRMRSRSSNKSIISIICYINRQNYRNNIISKSLKTNIFNLCKIIGRQWQSSLQWKYKI